MKFDKVAIALGAVIILLLAAIIVQQSGVAGLTLDKVEKNARKTHKIEANWSVAEDHSDSVCALLFFDEAKENYRFSVYFTGEDSTAGFLEGESSTEYPYMAENVQAINYQDKGIVLASLNREKVTLIVTAGEEVFEYLVSSGQPFVLVLPLDCGEITLYDLSGNEVRCYDAYR